MCICLGLWPFSARLIFSDWENIDDRSKSIRIPLVVRDWKNSVCAIISDPIILSFSDMVFSESEASICVDAYHFSHALPMVRMDLGFSHLIMDNAMIPFQVSGKGCLSSGIISFITERRGSELPNS